MQLHFFFFQDQLLNFGLGRKKESWSFSSSSSSDPPRFAKDKLELSIIIQSARRQTDFFFHFFVFLSYFICLDRIAFEIQSRRMEARKRKGLDYLRSSKFKGDSIDDLDDEIMRAH